MSKMFSLNWADFGQGLVFAIFTALVVYLQPLVTQADFSFTALDWGALINVVISAFIAYLGKNFISDEKGVPLGGFFRK